MKKILLVDGNSLLFRAYYASAYTGSILRTSTGIPTNAAYSFANMLTSLISERDYFDVKVAFDKGKKTFRHDKLEDYKAGRSATPEDLIPQFQIVREFLDSANISWYELENYEADDLIGSLTRKIENEIAETEVEILTSDKDMFQLISEKTKIVLPKTGVSSLDVFGLDELMEKWEVTPEMVPDLKGLMGDPSDNLKGVPGVGEKTAIKLLKKHGSVEKIYENIESESGSLKEKLIAGEQSALLCKEIATINCDVEIVNLKFECININLTGLIEYLKKYEMFSLVNRLSQRVEVINKIIEEPIKESLDFKVLEKWDQSLNCSKNFIYFESVEENYHKGVIIGVGIINSNGAFYLNSIIKDQAFEEFLNNQEFKKITYDIKKVWTLLKKSNMTFEKSSFIDDLMVASYVINPNLKSTIQNIQNIVSIDVLLEEDENIYGKGAKRNIEIDLDIKSKFIISKANVIQQSYPLIIEKLNMENQTELYSMIEFPLISVLFNMEQEGILIDRVELDKQTSLTLSAIESLEDKMNLLIDGYSDKAINFASPKQIQELLFNHLHLPSNKKQSTDKEALERIINLHPIVNLLIEHRKLSKLYSTYLRGFEKFIFNDNKIHTIFNQTLTNTGRLSSSEPNIQNISVKDETQKEVRKIFVVEPNKSFYSFDYSQIELRVLAQLGKEETLIDIFKNNRDIHTEAARKIFKIPLEQEVSSDQRRIAKVFNFGIIYGLSDFGLSNDLKISIPEAKNFIDEYYKSFPRLKDYKNELVSEAEKLNYATTFANRKRIVNELLSPNYQIKEFGKRIAVNMPIQGTAADILKVAMINIEKELKINNFQSSMVAQIHDEIIFEIIDSESNEVLEIIDNKMKSAFIDLAIIMNKTNSNIEVKLDVNSSNGKNWFELK